MKTLLNISILLALATGARADITVVFDQPDQIGHPGDTLQFFGTISNTGPDTVFLNSDDLTFPGNDFTVTDLFLVNAPISLDPGNDSGDIELFDVAISNPLSDPAGLYPGQYTLVGGIDGNAQDNLVSADFSVTTSSGGLVTTPEPSAITLFGLVVAALALGSKKTRA